MTGTRYYIEWRLGSPAKCPLYNRHLVPRLTDVIYLILIVSCFWTPCNPTAEVKDSCAKG